MRNLPGPEALVWPMKRLAILAAAASLSACLPHPPPAAAPYRAVGQSAAGTNGRHQGDHLGRTLA